ncbi:MAG: hypothetical protein ACP5I8_13340 [Phycisphaerae bacterium]
MATMNSVAEAVNAAKDGQLTNGSEEACREALEEFRRNMNPYSPIAATIPSRQRRTFIPGSRCSRCFEGPYGASI